MPLLHSIISSDYELYLWRPTEPLAELYSRALLSDEEQLFYSTLKHDRRQREYLTSRVMAQEFFGCSIAYLASGCPVAIGGKFSHISVSHTAGCVVLIGSCRVVGVDVEVSNRDFSRVSLRFINTSEARILDLLCASGINLNCARGLLWCAKEAVYKSVDFGDVDFKNQIIVDKVVTDMSFFSSKCNDLYFNLHYFFYENFICVYTV